MEQYVIRNRSSLWFGIAVFLLGVAVCIWCGLRYSLGVVAIGLIMVCFLFVSTACIYNGTQKTTFSEKGICDKTLFKTIIVSWNQIDKASVAWMHLGRSYQRYISVSWPGNPEKKHWVYRWLWFMKLENRDGLLFPYSDELRDLVVKYYGPLDFNEFES